MTHMPVPTEAQTTSQSKARRGARFASIGVAGALMIVTAAMTLNSGRIVDQLAVWQFTPSAAVSTLAASPNLTDEGRFLFLASAPQVSSAPQLNSVCAKNHEGSGILGCYQPFTRTINLFAVTDTRLAGLDNVVTAHEMLHAAWDRLSTGERDALVPLLEAQAKSFAHDATFTERMAYYVKNEPGERENELHSILGTEAAKLSPALENHYRKYLANRSAIVADNTGTALVFSGLLTELSTLSTKMASLNSDIEQQYAAYTSGYSTLNSDVVTFNAKTNFSSQGQLDAAVAALNSRQATLDASYVDLKQKSAAYLADYNIMRTLVEKTASLSTAINQVPPTALPPAPQ